MSSKLLLEARQLQRSFETAAGQVHVLRHVDLTLKAGELVALVGESGSGKSTLLQLLGLLDEPSSGQVIMTGYDCGSLSSRARAELRSKVIGYIFQAFYLIPHKTASENVQLSLLYAGVPRRERSTRAEEALARVGLAHRLNALPATMSGGEQQRVAIARALVRQPAILLCDEPTGNLDRKNTDNILQYLSDLVAENRGLAIVIVTHDERVADLADRRIHLVEGITR